MSFARFGPFATAFDSTGISVPGYLTLLWLGDEAPIVISRIGEALRAGDSQKWVTALFSEIDWRPHLVGAMAMLLSKPKDLDSTPLWAAIDAGSWVTPQLIASAVYTDASFPTKASQRMESGCPVIVPKGLDPITRHVATGPSGTTGRNGKMAASILAVCHLFARLSECEATWRAAPQLIALLKEDELHDGSERITKGWLSVLGPQMQKQGINLRIPDTR